LSLKYKTDDQLWFTFFHEAAHILRHQKKSIFLEGDEYESEEEKDANEFAAELLIPSRVFNYFDRSSPMSKPTIRKFAQSIGIAPGIVVGRLQHENVLPWNRYNDLKRRLKWKSE
jgi:HTH-type transcriptional regulator/antitoxin HigA